MKEVRIITIDERGRIVIPQIIRKSLGLTTNSQLMLVSDSDTKELKITPVGLKGESLKFRITMSDQAGSLAKLATIFAESGISLVYGESTTIEMDKTAIWTVIGPKPDIDIEEFTKKLKREGNAIKVEVIPLE